MTSLVGVETYFVATNQIKTLGFRSPAMARRRDVQMKLRFLKSLVFATLCIPIFAGCSHQGRFVYPARAPISSVSATPNPVTICVLPAVDNRPKGYRYAAIYILPLVPWGSVVNERPEGHGAFPTISRYDFKPKSDIAQAIADHLKAAGVAQNIITSSPAPEDAYKLQTEVKSTRYNGKVMTYGLSIFAYPLYILGFPHWRSDVHAEFHLKLSDPAGREIWSADIAGDWGLWQGFYYGLGRDMEGLAHILQNGLERELSANPPMNIGQTTP